MRDTGIKVLAFVVAVSRFVLPIAYALTVYWVISAIQSRSQSTLPTASRDLGRNHKIIAGDLETSVTDSMLGKYLAKDVKKGEAIDNDKVVDKPPSPLPTAARDLGRSHKIVAADLETSFAPPPLGKYLVKDVKKGDVVDSDTVADKPLSPLVIKPSPPRMKPARHRRSSGRRK